MATNYDCLAMARPDVPYFMRQWNTAYATASNGVIFEDWFRELGHKDSRDPAYFHLTLEDYAASLGCAPGMPAPSTPPVIPVPPNTSPGSGGRVVGGPEPGTPQGQLQAAMEWVKKNPLLAIAGFGALFLLFYKPTGFKID